MASAVSSASPPMRITAQLPLRTTPAPSANTLGLPSKTNATTPSGAARRSMTKPSPRRCSRTFADAARSGRPAPEPSTGMAARIFVVDPQPGRAATTRLGALHVGPVRRRDGIPRAGVAEAPPAKPRKNASTCAAVHAPERRHRGLGLADRLSTWPCRLRFGRDHDQPLDPAHREHTVAGPEGRHGDHPRSDDHGRAGRKLRQFHRVTHGHREPPIPRRMPRGPRFRARRAVNPSPRSTGRPFRRRSCTTRRPRPRGPRRARTR